MPLPKQPPKRYATWKDVEATLLDITALLLDISERVPHGIAPRKFRSTVRRARTAVLSAAAIASSRETEDIMSARKNALALQRAQGIPELAKHLPRRLQP